MRPTLIDVHPYTIPAAWSANATPLNPVNLSEKPAEVPYVSDWRERLMHSHSLAEHLRQLKAGRRRLAHSRSTRLFRVGRRTLGRTGALAEDLKRQVELLAADYRDIGAVLSGR